MAPPTPSKNLLLTKWGPLPVWVWSLIGIALAWAYSKYESNKASTAASSTSSTAATSAAEPASGSPYYVIENNQPPATTSVTVTPPGTGSSPPTNSSSQSGVATPVYTGSGTTPQSGYGGTTVTPGELIYPPVLLSASNTAQAVASKFGISIGHLAQANPGSGMGAGTTVGVPYQVQPGDTPASIAKKFGIGTQHLEMYLPINPT
jgi:LysM repeat protein